MKYSFLLIVLFFALSSCKTDEPDKVHEEAPHEEKEVMLTPAQLKSVGITYGELRLKNLSATLQANGVLDVPPQNLVTVSALMGGFIKSTKLLQGMKVRKGEVIAVIQNPEFIGIQQAYLENKSKLDLAELEYKRQAELAQSNVASQKIFQQVSAEYQGLKAHQSALIERLALIGMTPSSVASGTIKSTMSIVSPIKGYVTAVNVNIGKYVNPQDVICEIVNTDHLHVELTVFEKDLGKIKIGQKVRFLLVNESSNERTAKVYLINKKIAEDRTIRVHAHLDKEDPELVPNMYLKAFIEVQDQQVQALPDEAIVSSEGKFFVFVKAEEPSHTQDTSKVQPHEGQIFELIEVGKGVSEDGYTEVILAEGVNLKGKSIVIKGAYDLLSKMNNSEEEGHGH